MWCEWLASYQKYPGLVHTDLPLQLLFIHVLFVLSSCLLNPKCQKGENVLLVIGLGPLQWARFQLFQLLVKARRDQVLKLFAQVALIVHEFNPNILPKFK